MTSQEHLARIRKVLDHIDQHLDDELPLEKLAEMKAMKMPGNDKTMGEMMSDQEKSIKDFYNASNNTVEIYTPEKAKK